MQMTGSGIIMTKEMSDSNPCFVRTIDTTLPIGILNMDLNISGNPCLGRTINAT